MALFGPGVPAMAMAKAVAEASQARLATARGRNGIAITEIMARMEIRPARETDATALAEQMKVVVDEGRWLGTQPDSTVEDLAERFRAALAEDHILFLLEQDAQVAGAIGIHPTPIEGVHTLGMSILEEFRGRGWGRQLVLTALEEARGRGIVKVVLEVWPDNGRAIALYASAGFEIEGYKRNHYPRLDGSRRSAVMMARFL
jgi:ribosomal protein S18 acetylase RimI-like enzyme